MLLKQTLTVLLVVLNVFYISAQDKKIEIGLVFNPAYSSRSLTSSDEYFTDALNEQEGLIFGFGAGVQIAVLKKTQLELVTGLLYSKQGFDLGEINLPEAELSGKSICNFLQIPIRMITMSRQARRFISLLV